MPSVDPARPPRGPIDINAGEDGELDPEEQMPRAPVEARGPDLLPAVELARRLRAGRLEAPALLEAYIRRIEQVNPKINALVADRFPAARAEAEAAHRRLRAAGPHEVLPPLLGVPVTIKEFAGVEGMPHTAGLYPQRAAVAAADGTVTARMRAAGAIIMGVSNVPEGGLWMETYNKIWGRTNNPWDLRRSPGGSSGGEGALVASGCSPLGIGSDVGGSIRIPAAFCGTFGHKPSGRLVPNTGHHPGAHGPMSPYLCVGPLGRSVADLDLCLRVIAGPDGKDEACTGSYAGGYAEVPIEGMRVLALETNGSTRVCPELRAAVREAAEALEARGAVRVEIPLPRMREALLIWSAMLNEAATDRYDAVLGGGVPISLPLELLKFAVGRSDHTFAGLALTVFDVWGSKLPMNFARLVAEGRALQAEIEAAIGPHGVLLHPPYSRPAPYHRDSWRTPLDAACTAIFNVLELPVTVVPMGLGKGRLPLAVQVVGARGADAVTLAAAAALEDTFGGWVRAEP
jgi:fatty acid amide hydrolase 2